MTEPVAYLNSYKDKSTNITKFKPIDNTALVSSNKLYTYEQLHPRVKMTQTEFDEFNSLYSQGLLFSEAMEMLGTQGELERYVNIRNRIYTQYLRENMDSEVIFAQLWQLYNPNNPEETIEIAPDMKWFVRSKEKYQPDMDQGISESGYLYLTQGDIYSIEYHEMTSFKDDATQFDTKSEAEKWKNPSTDVVLLPIEGDD